MKRKLNAAEAALLAFNLAMYLVYLPIQFARCFL